MFDGSGNENRRIGVNPGGLGEHDRITAVGDGAAADDTLRNVVRGRRDADTVFERATCRP